jgi:hypothetical protein
MAFTVPTHPFFVLLLQKIQAYTEDTQAETLYLHLDRSLYQPGETIWWSAYLRDANTLQVSQQSQVIYVELIDGKGAIVYKKTYSTYYGNASGEFDLPPNIAGGLYKIKAYTAWQRNTDTFLNAKSRYKRRSYRTSIWNCNLSAKPSERGMKWWRAWICTPLKIKLLRTMNLVLRLRWMV